MVQYNTFATYSMLDRWYVTLSLVLGFFPSTLVQYASLEVSSSLVSMFLSFFHYKCFRVASVVCNYLRIKQKGGKKTTGMTIIHIYQYFFKSWMVLYCQIDTLFPGLPWNKGKVCTAIRCMVESLSSLKFVLLQSPPSPPLITPHSSSSTVLQISEVARN